MIYLKLILLTILVFPILDLNAQQKKISIEISTEQDTIVAGEPVMIHIQITNISDKRIQLTKNFTFASNIYPNPVEQVSQGTRLVFDITPNPIGGDIWVENQLFVQEIELQNLAPHKSITLQYDLNKHLNDFISIGSFVPTTNINRISLTYELSKGRKQEKLVTGNVKSNEITFYLKK